MPHKRNPISLENLTGIARYIRNSIGAFLENVIVWQERDISHSSVERILAPDITMAIAYSLKRLNLVLSKVVVNKDKVQGNLKKQETKILSSFILNELIQSGIPRQEAYKLVQEASFKGLDTIKAYDTEAFYKKLMKHAEIIYSRILR